MRPSWPGVLILVFVPLAAVTAQTAPPWHDRKQSPSDLEISGDLRGVPPGSKRYVSRESLLRLPQTNFTATGDTNFAGATTIRGVALEILIQKFAASPAETMAVAICDDEYRASYPRAYLAAHHPVLVLEVNGKPPSGWPKDSQEHKWDMGPYMVSNPKFAPSFKILAHEDEAQIPWGVVGIELRDEKAVLGLIAPRGSHANDRDVQDGFRIAAQNCFRCHDSGGEGGRKSGRPWDMLGMRAAASPKEFAAYTRDPKSKNPPAQMPANPQYDDATLAALTAYFKTFGPGGKL